MSDSIPDFIALSGNKCKTKKDLLDLQCEVWHFYKKPRILCNKDIFLLGQLYNSSSISNFKKIYRDYLKERNEPWYGVECTCPKRKSNKED